MQSKLVLLAQNYASASEKYANADFDIAQRYFAESLNFAVNGESHNRARGVKNPIMIGVYLNEDSIYMLEKLTEFLKSTGRLNCYAKRQDAIRLAFSELFQRSLEDSAAANP